MFNDHENSVITIALIVLVLMWGVIGFTIGLNVGYKGGQIDALSKKFVSYELTTNDDSSKTWKRIEKK